MTNTPTSTAAAQAPTVTTTELLAGDLIADSNGNRVRVRAAMPTGDIQWQTGRPIWEIVNDAGRTFRVDPLATWELVERTASPDPLA